MVEISEGELRVARPEWPIHWLLRGGCGTEPVVTEQRIPLSDLDLRPLVQRIATLSLEPCAVNALAVDGMRVTLLHLSEAGAATAEGQIFALPADWRTFADLLVTFAAQRVHEDASRATPFGPGGLRPVLDSIARHAGLAV